MNIGDLNDPVGNPTPKAKISGVINATFGAKPNIIIHSYGPGAIGKTFFPLAFGWTGPRVARQFRITSMSSERSACSTRSTR